MAECQPLPLVTDTSPSGHGCLLKALVSRLALRRAAEQRRKLANRFCLAHRSVWREGRFARQRGASPLTTIRVCAAAL